MRDWVAQLPPPLSRGRERRERGELSGREERNRADM